MRDYVLLGPFATGDPGRVTTLLKQAELCGSDSYVWTHEISKDRRYSPMKRSIAFLLLVGMVSGPTAAQPQPCPVGIGAEVDDDTMVLSWSNGDTVPNSVDIRRNGDLIADDAEAASETYVDQDVRPGAYTYELTFDVTGGTCNPVTLEEVSSCLSGLWASNRPEGVRLSWTNARLYDTIVVRVDGEEIDDLDGDLEEYTDAEATLGLHTYEVVPDEGICDPATITFDVIPPPEEGENVLVNGGFEDGVLEPWFAYGDVAVEVVEEFEEAAVDEDPVEGSRSLRIDVPAAGANFWDAGLVQEYPFTKGVVYTLSAFLKTQEGEMQINFKPEQGCCGFLGFGEQQFTFGEEWTEFSVTTPPMAEAVPEGQTVFHVAYVPGVFWMDGVRFYEGPYVPPDFGPDPDGPVFLRGDCNGDGRVDISDVICVVTVLFPGFNLLDRSSPASPCSTDAGNVAVLDASGNETLDVADIVGLASFLFGNGPPPGPPCELLDRELGCPANPGCQ